MGSKIGYAKSGYALFGAILFSVFFLFQAEAYGFTVYWLYKLANFSGGIPFSYGAQLAMDQYTGEAYVIDPTHGGVSIFNNRGMEIYQFGQTADLGSITSLAVDKNGDILTLSYNYNRGANWYYIGLCNYRGELERKIYVTGLPAAFSTFQPGEIMFAGGRLYLIDLTNLLVAQVDRKGVCLKTWDINHITGWDKRPDRVGAFGFTIDTKGNMYFTIPTAFRAFRVTPEGKVDAFGQGGDGPGKFGVVSGITVDSRGYLYITDKLRCVVLIFDKDLNFVREFGFRSYGPGGLIVPDDDVISSDGTLYVAQGANQGVDVFRMGYD